MGESLGGPAATRETQNASDVSAHWLMEPYPANLSEWSFRSIPGPVGGDPHTTWLLGGGDPITNRLLYGGGFAGCADYCCAQYVAPNSSYPVLFSLEEISSGAFRVAGTSWPYCDRFFIIEAYPRNFSLCPDVSISRSFSMSCAPCFWLLPMWLCLRIGRP